MATRDLVDHLKVVQSLAPQQFTATVNGTGVDTRGFSSCMMVLDTGVIGGTATPTFTFKMQESDDDVGYTDVAAADIQGGGQVANIVAATDNALYKRGYIGVKRYVRWAIDAVSGTSPTLFGAASVALGDGHAPVA